MWTGSAGERYCRPTRRPRLVSGPTFNPFPRLLSVFLDRLLGSDPPSLVAHRLFVEFVAHVCAFLLHFGIRPAFGRLETLPQTLSVVLTLKVYTVCSHVVPVSKEKTKKTP